MVRFDHPSPPRHSWVDRAKNYRSGRGRRRACPEADGAFRARFGFPPGGLRRAAVDGRELRTGDGVLGSK